MRTTVSISTFEPQAEYVDSSFTKSAVELAAAVQSMISSGGSSTNIEETIADAIEEAGVTV